jgi:hypothetical protein
LSGVELALLDLGLVVLADRGHAAVQRLLLHLEDRHRDAGVEEVHGDAAAHGAGADDGHLGDRAQRACLSGTSGILLAARSPKKAWRSALRLGRQHQRDEELALAAPCRRRRLALDGGLDGVDALARRREVPGHAP